jgi:anti-sigma regulatory factor (Ser/Thr protein kinase)/anti-anti-sigma regulatory factor
MTAPTPLRIDRRLRDGATIVVPTGVLDLASYAQLRDTLIKCALEVPRAIVVDLGSLHIPTPATLTVFTTVWMRVSDWPGVPILLVVTDPDDRAQLRRRRIDRYLPICSSLDQALRAVGTPLPRYRFVVDLVDLATASRVARRLVEETCRRWGCTEQLVEDALMVANALVDNAVRHAPGQPSLRLELRSGLITVAVYDDGPAFLRPGTTGSTTQPGLGFRLVDGLTSSWGCSATPFGRKVVWAVLRPLNHIS